MQMLKVIHTNTSSSVYLVITAADGKSQRIFLLKSLPYEEEAVAWTNELAAYMGNIRVAQFNH